ncbi:MAG: DUF4339 domain-containing protein [Deltaproteobacteria bacterium]|nr:DUF4339 domain-containing protein [Deltaproteobacteria bacterium]
MSLDSLPAPDAPVVHVSTARGQVGPWSRIELSARLDGGEVQRDDHFWYDGLAGWLPLSAHPELLQDLAAEPPPSPADGRSQDDFLDDVFGELIHQSWAYHNAHTEAGHIDEVFLGALITATLDNGLALIDITSDGTHHYLRFEDFTDHSRVIYRMTHLTGTLISSKVLGHQARVVVGYGERVKNFGTVWKALKAEWKSGYLTSDEPGTISVDGDMNSSYIYVQVDMFWRLDDYIGERYATDYEKLRLHLDASVHALRKYLRGRFA